MTTMQIHCPGCDVRLEVPADAGGRAARCPACKTKFQVPDPRTMLDETITCWMNLDQLDDEDEHREEAIDQMGRRVAAERNADDGDRNGVTKPPRRPETNESQSRSAPTSDADRHIRRVVKRGDSNDRAASPPAEPGLREGGRGSFVVSNPPPARSARRIDDAVTDRPTLQIVDIGAYGVKFGFDSQWLNSPAFRASLPMCGIVSGQTDPAKLIARPLAWVDKATGHFTNVGELEARYELHPRGAQTAREITEAMSTLDELPPPFNQPMPYYVSRAEAGKVTVHCETVATPRGVRCEVTIPSQRYALDWLGRVNGVCGEDYAALEAETLKFEAEAWRAIPQTVRHRLAVWFDFKGDEQFLGYFNDSDFSKSDAGLAGLVVTTDRLVFCRYHHHGAFSLHEAGTLQAIEDGKFATLYHRSDGSRRKLVRLRSEDVEQLADLVATLNCTMEMTIEAPPPGGYSVSGSDAHVDIRE